MDINKKLASNLIVINTTNSPPIKDPTMPLRMEIVATIEATRYLSVHEDAIFRIEEFHSDSYYNFKVNDNDYYMTRYLTGKEILNYITYAYQNMLFKKFIIYSLDGSTFTLTNAINKTK